MVGRSEIETYVGRVRDEIARPDIHRFYTPLGLAETRSRLTETGDPESLRGIRFDYPTPLPSLQPLTELHSELARINDSVEEQILFESVDPTLDDLKGWSSRDGDELFAASARRHGEVPAEMVARAARYLDGTVGAERQMPPDADADAAASVLRRELERFGLDGWSVGVGCRSQQET